MPIVKKTFSRTTAAGTTLYKAGSAVPDEVAKAFPQFMEGGKETARIAHDPALPEKLSAKAVKDMDAATLLRWVRQFHSEAAPDSKATKEDLEALVNELNGR